jgi:flagellar biosynthesis/type III secretory pathway protein FliH
MKKVIILLLAILTVTFLSSCYSESDVARARREGYEEGYDLAKYEAKGDIERVRHEEVDRAYEAGYEAGYEDGYYDGLDEQDPESAHGFGRIEKDK